MHMRLGKLLTVTLFGESHGAMVGALIEGIPPGVVIDQTYIQECMDMRRPGGHFASKRKESDIVEISTGVYEGTSTGQPILLIIRNNDARSSDYSFIPNHPRPGHQDMVMNIRTDGHADLRLSLIHI